MCGWVEGAGVSMDWVWERCFRGGEGVDDPVVMGFQCLMSVGINEMRTQLVSLLFDGGGGGAPFTSA